jgi:hypothetical protein
MIEEVQTMVSKQTEQVSQNVMFTSQLFPIFSNKKRNSKILSKHKKVALMLQAIQDFHEEKEQKGKAWPLWC